MVVRTLALVLVRRLLGPVGLGPAPDAKDIEIASSGTTVTSTMASASASRRTVDSRVAGVDVADGAHAEPGLCANSSCNRFRCSRRRREMVAKRCEPGSARLGHPLSSPCVRALAGSRPPTAFQNTAERFVEVNPVERGVPGYRLAPRNGQLHSTAPADRPGTGPSAGCAARRHDGRGGYGRCPAGADCARPAG